MNVPTPHNFFKRTLISHAVRNMYNPSAQLATQRLNSTIRRRLNEKAAKSPASILR